MNSIVEKYHADDLTPVGRYGDILYKRDDLFQPFNDIPINGGKVRQYMHLLENNEDFIRNSCNSNVYFTSGMHTSQGTIMARVAREFGFNPVVFVGNSKPSTFRKNKLMMNILAVGGRVNFDAKAGYGNVLESVLSQRRREGDEFFKTNFESNLDINYDSLINPIANQVQNIPHNLDYLIVPCGACITFSAVIKGLQKYKIYPKHVVGIQISGYDRKDLIESVLGDNHLPYELIISKDYPYSKLLKNSYVYGDTGPLQIDPNYEAKTLDYVNKYMGDKIAGKRVLIWLVGDSTPLRNRIYVREGEKR